MDTDPAAHEVRIMMHFRRFAPCLLLTLFVLPLGLLPARPAAAQDAPPHEGEAPRYKSKKAQPAQTKQAPVAKAAAAKAPAAPAQKSGPAAGQKKASPKAARGPAVKNDGKPYLRSLDKNHDGRISHDEFVAGSKKRFAKADTNHDGVVSPQEAKAAKAKMLEKQAKRDAKRLAEGKPVKRRKKTDRPPKPYLSTFDANQDGRVSQKEYLTRRENKFRDMDLNHDGVISREEARIAKVKLLERREERKAEAKARKDAEGTVSSPGPELTAPVTPPPAAAPASPSGSAPAAVPTTKRQPDLPLTPIAPEVPAKATPET